MVDIISSLHHPSEQADRTLTYQFIPETFDRLVWVLKLSPNMVFGSDIQDLMARRLIKEAGVNSGSLAIGQRGKRFGKELNHIGHKA